MPIFEKTCVLFMPMMLVAIGQTVDTKFSTRATANNYWCEISYVTWLAFKYNILLL